MTVGFQFQLEQNCAEWVMGKGDGESMHVPHATIKGRSNAHTTHKIWPCPRHTVHTDLMLL